MHTSLCVNICTLIDMRTAENLIAHELIGLDVQVTKSADRNRVGTRGTIINETERTFVVRTAVRDVIVPKNDSTFLFQLGTKRIEVQGWTLVAKPEERTRRALRLLR